MLDLTLPIRHMKVHVYTEHHLIVGTVATRHERLSDALNNADLELRLTEIVAVSHRDPGLRFAGQSATLLKSSACFVCDRPENGYQPGRRPAVVERVPVQVTFSCGPFVVQGTAHLPPGGDLRARLLGNQFPFFPITQARISMPHHRTFTEEAVMINRDWVGFVLEDGEAASR